MVLMMILMGVVGLIYSDLNSKYGLTLTGWRYGVKQFSPIEHECQKHHITGAVRVRSVGRKAWFYVPEEFWDDTDFVV